MATCESHLDPRAVNSRSGASGLFQFKPSTYAANGGHDLWSPAEQAEVAAAMFQQGQSGQWECR